MKTRFRMWLGLRIMGWRNASSLRAGVDADVVADVAMRAHETTKSGAIYVISQVQSSLAKMEQADPELAMMPTYELLERVADGIGGMRLTVVPRPDPTDVIKPCDFHEADYE